MMLDFWMLLGGTAGINLMQAVWRLFGWSVGEVSIAVPVGGGVGAIVGFLLGLIQNPRVLVLLLAVFSGSAAGAVAGRLPWGAVGEISGQAIGGLVGGLAWAAWRRQRGHLPPMQPSLPVLPRAKKKSVKSEKLGAHRARTSLYCKGWASLCPPGEDAERDSRFCALPFSLL